MGSYMSIDSIEGACIALAEREGVQEKEIKNLSGFGNDILKRIMNSNNILETGLNE